MIQPRLKDEYFVAHEFEAATVAAAGLSGTVSFDLLTVNPETPVGNIIIDGTMNAVTLGPIVNQVEEATTHIILKNPGVNTWAVDASYKWWGPRLEAGQTEWQAGKSAFYQVKLVDGVQYISGTIEGGLPVPSSAGLDLPIPASGGGTEVQWTNVGATPSYVRGYLGNMAAAATTIIGSAQSGSIDQIIETWGGVITNDVPARSFHVPYVHPDSAQFGIGIFVGSSNELIYSQGTARQNAAYTYQQWVRYTKS